ncbi:MAG TPA: tetratricopeptide repeat protein [Candidatus Moranbacteria bacterium]|nr:tetratricopeptide repeat protein [Candidatus Moranbacteria bacterium]
MNLTSLLLLGLIFLSLAVIVLIFSKNVEKISRLKENISTREDENLKKIKWVAFWNKVKNGFLSFKKNSSESISLENLEKQGPDFTRKEDIREEQQKNQWSNLADSDEVTLERFIKSKKSQVTHSEDDKTLLSEDETFSSKQKPTREMIGGMLTNFFKKEKRGKDNFAEDNNLSGEILLSEKEEGEDFSEAIVSIRERSSASQKEEGNFVKDVVAVEKRLTFDDDVDLGVDYRILEKKILQRVEKNPKDIEVFRQLGELYIKMGEFSDAEEVYKFILKTSPRNSDAKRKLEKIKLLRRLKKRG